MDQPHSNPDDTPASPCMQCACAYLHQSAALLLWRGHYFPPDPASVVTLKVTSRRGGNLTSSRSSCLGADTQLALLSLPSVAGTGSVESGDMAQNAFCHSRAWQSLPGTPETNASTP